MSAAVRLYRALLHAYPPAFRERFGAGMLQAFRDRRRAAAARGRAAVAALMLRTVVDVLVNATAIRVHQTERTPMNWQSLVLDTRYACRMFLRNPVFSMLAVAAFFFNDTANTEIYTIVNGVLLKPLPYGDPGRLVMIWSSNAIEHRDHDVVSPPRRPPARCPPTTSPARWRASPTSVTEGRSAPRSTRRRRRTC